MLTRKSSGTPRSFACARDRFGSKSRSRASAPVEEPIEREPARRDGYGDCRLSGEVVLGGSGKRH